MTPKEKAKELFDKYFNIIYNCHPLTDINISAKQCALISANELIEEAYFTDGYYDRETYWEEIKQEIENL